MFRKLVLIILLFSQPYLVVAQDKKPAPQETPQTTTKAAWSATLNEKLPQDLCRKESQFLTCFEIEPAECQTMVAWFSKSCLTNMSSTLPQTLSSKEGEKYGQILGRCVYDLYNMFLAEKKIDNEECPSYEPPEGMAEAPEPMEPSTLIDPTQPRTAQ